MFIVVKPGSITRSVNWNNTLWHYFYPSQAQPHIVPMMIKYITMSIEHATSMIVFCCSDTDCNIKNWNSTPFIPHRHFIVRIMIQYCGISLNWICLLQVWLCIVLVPTALSKIEITTFACVIGTAPPNCNANKSVLCYITALNMVQIWLCSIVWTHDAVYVWVPYVIKLQFLC